MPDLMKKWGVTHHEARMSTSNFWTAVDQAGWGRHKDYNKVKEFMLERFTQREAEEFRATFNDLQSKLSRTLDRWADENDIDWGLGDDSWGDLLAHIIGLGKREYEATMRDPQKALDRANRNDYRESFAYGIPWDDDYADKARQPQSTDTIDVFGAWALPERFRKNLIAKLNTDIQGLEKMAAGIRAWEAQHTKTQQGFKSLGEWATKHRDPDSDTREYYDWISHEFQSAMIYGTMGGSRGQIFGTTLSEIQDRIDTMQKLVKELNTTKRPANV